MVTFNATGDAASGTYDIDLLKGNNEVRKDAEKETRACFVDCQR